MFCKYSFFESAHIDLPVYLYDNNSTSTTKALKTLYSNPDQNLEYNEYFTLGSHNSFSYPDDNLEKSIQSILAQNQIMNFTQQLEFGVRAFFVDIYWRKPEDTIKFSHGYKGMTLAFTKDWTDFLTEINTFLTSNQNEIITIHLESYVKNHSRIMEDIVKTGLTNYLYVVDENVEHWDTIDKMINDNKRLLIFSDANEDYGPGIMNTRYYVLENNYKGKGCIYRDFGRLKPPENCASPENLDIGLYDCTRENMRLVPLGETNNRGAIIFVMNAFQIERALHHLKRLWKREPIFNSEIIDYFEFLNSRQTLINRIKDCYCNFTIPKGSLLQLQDNSQEFVESASQKTMKLGVLPSIIALDFVGVGEKAGDSARELVLELLTGQFSALICDSNKAS